MDQVENLPGATNPPQFMLFFTNPAPYRPVYASNFKMLVIEVPVGMATTEPKNDLRAEIIPMAISICVGVLMAVAAAALTVAILKLTFKSWKS